MASLSRQTRRRVLGTGSLRGVLVRLVAALAAVLGVLIAVAIVGILTTSGDYRSNVLLSLDRQAAANQLLIDLLNAETGNRGYTLTGRGLYLQPYRETRARYPEDLARLRDLVSDEPELREAVEAVDRRAQLWFDEARNLIALRRQRMQAEAIARITSGLATLRFDAFRAEHAALVEKLEDLRADSLASTDRRRLLTLVTIVAAAALAFLVVALAAGQLWRRIGGPIALLAAGVGRVARGRFTDPVPPSPGAVRELAELSVGFNDMQFVLVEQRDTVAQAARREAAQQTERRLWETVQMGLLPARLPQVPDMRLAARYQPAEPGLLIGGDFYDACLLKDGRLALMVGDVAGHGAPAAGRAAGLRFGWRTLVEVDPDPAKVMAALNAQMGNRDDRAEGLFASLCYALVDTEGNVSFAPAGHPPPILLTPEGSHLLTPHAAGPLLGVLDRSEWPVTRITIPIGGTLVLYTDGLVEARKEADTFGTERARRVLESERRSALEVRVQRLIDAARRHDAENLRDDVVVLACERVTPLRV
jgi:serine phosphatase RsbU (regulator of sigma subunit)/CHASE3 domain sensor protein